MDASYELDGGQVDLTRINLTMAGFTSRLTGEVDLLNWPEQTYRIIESDIELPPMKDIFFAGDNFTVDGRASFTGAWHIFDGGHELTGRFHGADTTFNDLGFPGLKVRSCGPPIVSRYSTRAPASTVATSTSTTR